MRGILFRTDEEGNVLEKPEVKVSAVRGNNIKVYANQEAKNAALENGDIKPGDVVLSGGEQYGSGCNPIWDEAINVPVANINNYVAPEDGILIPIIYSSSGIVTYYINNIQVGLAEVGGGFASVGTGSFIVNRGDKLTYTGTIRTDVSKLTFVPRR